MTLRWKIVGLYGVILAAVIAAFSVALAYAFRGNLLAAVDRELEARARGLVGLVEFEDGRWFAEEKSGLKDEYAAGTGRYYVVHDAAGVRVLASPAAQTGGREVTLKLVKLRDAEEGGPPIPLTVTVGKSLAEVDAAMASLVGRLWTLGPIALVLSMAGGLLLASRALRPIDRMARTAGEINATDLSRRLDVSGNDEMARLGRTLNDMIARLQESFDRQTRFTADASHELRTPLSVIAGNVELALKRPRTVEEHRDILKDIGEASDRMRSIVEGLLTLARADARSVALKREPVSLTAVADEIVRLCRPLAEAQNVRLAVESEGDVVVLGDRERLKELVSNLVTNAIRYNRPNGAVTVRLAAEPGRGRMTVDDTGIGIPAEDLPHIFERFYRVDKARSREVGGSGLGLAIAKWIVDAHAGSIHVTSRPGDGSRFEVTLPMLASAAATS